MSKNILDFTRKNLSNKRSEGFAERITLTKFKGPTGQEIQLTLGNYPYRFIHLDRKSVLKIVEKLQKYLEGEE